MTSLRKPKPKSIIGDRQRLGLGVSTLERFAKTGEDNLNLSGDDRTPAAERTQVLTDWPLQQLYDRRMLSSNPETNKARYEAGKRLYRHWYHAGMVPLGSRDYSKPHGGAYDVFAIAPDGFRQEANRQHYRNAVRALGQDRIGAVTVMVVLDEQPLAKVGKRVCDDRTHEAQCRAVAIEFLKDGLDRLIRLWS